MIQSVSVVTVTLNTADTIQLTLDSVKQQHFDRVQHVIIDGGSTDGTREIIEAAVVGILVSEPDNGIYDAMEKGKSLATNDIVVFLNAGDVFADENVCSDVVAHFNETRADIVFGNFVPYLINPDDEYDHKFVPGKIYDLAYVRDRRNLSNSNIHHQALFYSRAVTQCCSFFSPELPRGSDWEFNVSAIVEHGFRTCHIPRLVTRFALGGLTTSNFDQELKVVADIRAILQKKYFATEPNYQQDEFDCTGVNRDHAKPTPANQAVPAVPASPPRGPDRTLRSLPRRLWSRLPWVKTRRAIWNQLADISRHTQTGNQQLQAMDIRLAESEARSNAAVTSAMEQLARVQQATASLQKQQAAIQENIAMLLIGQQPDNEPIRPSAHGFQVYSQFDEDGIIQHLIKHVDIPNKAFIEFGVENYLESNTRFLLTHNNWRGLILDSSERHIETIKGRDFYCRHNLMARQAFVNRDNINELFAQNGLSGDIGLLSIDVDGVDYWLWEACTQVDPRIVIIEYNSAFGNNTQVAVPYEPSFDRSEIHYSHIYAGASLGAMVDLGTRKGYRFVGSNCAGNNAFFVRNDCLGDLPVSTVAEGYVKAQFRESRDPSGNLSFLPIEESIKLLDELPLIDVSTGNRLLIRDLAPCYG